MLIAAFVAQGPLLIALDDTIERRRGAKIAAVGYSVTFLLERLTQTACYVA